MARKSRRSLGGSAISERSLLSSRVLSPSYWNPVSDVFRAVEHDLSAIEDRRLWHPDVEHGALTVGGRVARVVVHKRPVVAYSRPIYAKRGLPVGLQVPVGVQFESPLRVVRCLRRKIRREVIFAKDKIYRTRVKGSGSKRRRRNGDSGVSC